MLFRSLCEGYEGTWQLDGPDADGQYVAYYNGELEGTYFGHGEGTDLCIKVCLNGPSTGNEFQGKRFVLTGTFDAIQTTNGASMEVWNWSPGN